MSTSLPDSVWFLQATDADAARALAGAALVDRPTKLFCPLEVWDWLAPELPESFRVARKHRLLAMSCSDGDNAAGGRWAGEGDLDRLKTYRRMYDAERKTRGKPATTEDLRQRRVAVFDHDGQIVSVLRHGGDTDRYGCIGGTYTFPQWRGRGFAKRLVAFMVRALAKRGKTAHLIVDDDNRSAIALYEAAGFKRLGEVSIGYLNYETARTRPRLPSDGTESES